MELKELNTLQAIAKKINETLKVDNILCFGKRTCILTSDNAFQNEEKVSQTYACYDLLVISETDDQDILSLQEHISEDLNISVNLLVHTAEEIVIALTQGNHFFSTIFEKANQMYLNSSFKILKPEKPADCPNALTLWQHHYNKALAFHSEAENLLCTEDNLQTFDLIVQSLEETIIGLLQACLEYLPKLTDLTYLLPLCDIVSNQFENIIPRKTPEDEAHYKMLSRRNSGTAQTQRLLADPFTIIFLHQQCAEFLKIAEQVFENKHGKIIDRVSYPTEKQTTAI